MKKLLIAVTLLLGLSAMANSSHNNRHNDKGRYCNPHPSYKTYKKQKTHFGRVLRSKPTYRKKYSHHKRHQLRRHSVGYRNIAYWNDRKITRMSDRPRHKVRLDRKHHGRSCSKRD